MTSPARPLLALHLAGDQAAMGAQHGRLLRELGAYEETLAFYARLPERLLSSGDRSLRLAAALRTLRPAFELALRHLERHRPAAYLARSRAFMQALGRPAGDSRYLLVVDLAQNLIGLAGRLGIGPFAKRAGHRFPGACSSVAVWGEASEGGRLLHARNFDFPGIGVWDRGPTVVFCAPDDGLRYGFLTTRGADVPGVTAFNEAGLTLSAHTRFHRDVSWSGASIIDLGHDIARRAETLADAIAIARERRVASTWGLLVSSSRERGAIHLETTAAGVEIVRPALGRSALWCANRYHCPRMSAGEVSPSPAWRRFSDGREAVMARWATRGAPLDVADLQTLLGSHEAPDGGVRFERALGGTLAQAVTVQSVVADPERRTLHISIGRAPTSRGPWVEVPWRWRQAGTWELHAPPPDRDQPADRFALGAAGEAYAALIDATRLDFVAAPEPEVRARIELAAALAPDEPGYRLLAAGFALRRGATAEARAHLAHALTHERSEFRRGELWLWAARAADAQGDAAAARAYRASLLATSEPLLAQARADARADARRPYPNRKLRRVAVDLQLATLH